MEEQESRQGETEKEVEIREAWYEDGEAHANSESDGEREGDRERRGEGERAHIDWNVV